LRTKEQKKKYDRAYYLSHRKQILARSAAHHKKHQARTNERQREYHHRVVKWKLIPGWNKALYFKKLEEQNRLCAICRVILKEPVRDHDHKTGLARGLICHSCNRLLGAASDNSQTLNSAIEYLEIYNVRQDYKEEDKTEESPRPGC